MHPRSPSLVAAGKSAAHYEAEIGLKNFSPHLLSLTSSRVKELTR